MSKNDFKILWGIYRKNPRSLTGHSLFKTMQSISRNRYKTDSLIKNQANLKFKANFIKAFNRFCSDENISSEDFVGGIA